MVENWENQRKSKKDADFNSRTMVNMGVDKKKRISPRKITE